MMFKKILAIILALILTLNLCTVAYAKTNEEKEAEKEANKEFRLQQKREKELLKMRRKTNIHKVEEWAEKGDIQAKMILGYLHEKGIIYVRNKKIAQKIYDEVAEINKELSKNFVPIEYAFTKIQLSRLYGLAACRSQVGMYVDQNFDDALRWAELGASENDTLSCAIVGSAYYTGRGVRQDFKMAMTYFKKAPQEPITVYHLIDAYEKGNGVDQNLDRSRFYADYLQNIMKPKIESQRNKNADKKDRQVK